MRWRLNLEWWDWRAEGFLAPPKRTVLTRLTVLHRAWGGASSEAGHPSRPGVCLSFDVPRTRREAEALFAVFEWGNTCRYLTSFELQAGAVVWVGTAHPGEFHGSELGAPGSQVFVETLQMHRFARPCSAARLLVDDLGKHVVVSNRDPGVSRSS